MTSVLFASLHRESRRRYALHTTGIGFLVGVVDKQGAIYSRFNVEIRNSVMNNNSASGNGGAIYVTREQGDGVGASIVAHNYPLLQSTPLNVGTTL